MEPTPVLDWYVVKVQTNRESSIRVAIERRIERDGLGSSFGRIVIPTEKFIENKTGKKTVKDRKLFPGYIFIEMVMTDDAWYLVRDISGVGDFTGSTGRPHTMEASEVERMLGASILTASSPKIIPIDFAPGDVVKVKTGPFEAFDGTVESVDGNSGKVAVLIEIFGRPTPIEFEYHEIDRS